MARSNEAVATTFVADIWEKEDRRGQYFECCDEYCYHDSGCALASSDLTEAGYSKAYNRYAYQGELMGPAFMDVESRLDRLSRVNAVFDLFYGV